MASSSPCSSGEADFFSHVTQPIGRLDVSALIMSTASKLSLAAFIALPLLGGAAIGVTASPDAWYDALKKPFFNPPNWVFGPVWTVLYIMIGIAGWRTWQRRYQGLVMQVWFAQLALNFLWTPVFFIAHALATAFAIALAMLGAILCFIALTWNSDRVSAWLFVPYAAWVGFAAELNAALFYLNT